MTKLWAILGALLLLAGLGLYLDQWIRYGVHWDWEQFLHHESFIALAGGIGLVLLIVAMFDSVKNKRGQK